MIEEAYSKAKSLLEKNMDRLHAVAKTLMEKETLEADEFMELMKKFDGPDKPDPSGNNITGGEMQPVINFTFGIRRELGGTNLCYDQTRRGTT